MRFHLATLSEERYEVCEESLPAGAPSVCVGELGIGGYELRIFSSSKATWATGGLPMVGLLGAQPHRGQGVHTTGLNDCAVGWGTDWG